jgi:hypothetical protein
MAHDQVVSHNPFSQHILVLSLPSALTEQLDKLFFLRLFVSTHKTVNNITKTVNDFIEHKVCIKTAFEEHCQQSFDSITSLVKVAHLTDHNILSLALRIIIIIIITKSTSKQTNKHRNIRNQPQYPVACAQDNNNNNNNNKVYIQTNKQTPEHMKPTTISCRLRSG